MKIQDMTLSNTNTWVSLTTWRHRPVRNRNYSVISEDMPDMWRSRLPRVHEIVAKRIRTSYGDRQR